MLPSRLKLLDASDQQDFSVNPLLPQMSLAEFRILTTVLGEHIGFRFPDNKLQLVSARLASRLRGLGLDTYQAYTRFLQSPAGEQEMQFALELITTNETYFFREPEHFVFLRDVVLPPLRRSRKPVRAWSGACSRGQEAYSMAMVLANDLGLHSDWQVIGTDISEKVLRNAQQALYSMQESEHIAGHDLKSYCLRGFDEYEGQFLVGRPLRRHVNFQRINLMKSLPPDLTGFDVVFLRNVMIYFENVRKDELIEQIAPRIKPGGYLIVGHAESMSVRGSGFTQLRPSIYIRE